MSAGRLSLARDSAVIVLAFVLLHGAFVLFAPEIMRVNESLDFIDFYYPIAQRLTEGLGIAEAHYFEHMGLNPVPTEWGEGVFVTRFPPGYAVLLAPVIVLADAIGMPHADAFVVLSRMFALASVLLLYAIVRRGFGCSAIALAAALVWMLYPPSLFLAKQPNSENPFLTLLFAAILAFLVMRPGIMRGVVIGLLLGVALYVRLAGLFLPVAFAAIVIGDGFMRREKVGPGLAPAALILTLPYLLVLPWVTLIYHETGQFVPVASTGADLISSASSELLRSIPEESWLWAEGLRDYVAQQAQGTTVTASPGHELQLLAVKILRAFYGTFTLRHETLLATMEVVYLGSTAVGILISIRAFPARPSFHLCAGVLFLYFLSTAVFGVPLLRYTVPAHALLTGYVGCLITLIVARVFERGGGSI